MDKKIPLKSRKMWHQGRRYEKQISLQKEGWGSEGSVRWEKKSIPEGYFWKPVAGENKRIK